jgi:hypothetical protein
LEFHYLGYYDKKNHLFFVKVYHGDVIDAVYNSENPVYGLHFLNKNEIDWSGLWCWKTKYFTGGFDFGKERMSVSGY